MRVILLLILTILVGFSFETHAEERVAPASQSDLLLSYSKVVKKVSPAVVNIYSNRKVAVSTSPFFNDPFFNQFFGRNLFPQMKKERVVNSLGSGVIVDPSGLLLTNLHVIKNADEIKVVLADRREYQAKILIADDRTDLALLRIQSNGELFSAVKMANSDDLEVGDVVLAIGNPFGIGQTVTSGIISALARTDVGISDYEFFVQTDAAINPGNSGGALVNSKGELVGINTAIFSKSGASHGIGFATPSNMASWVVRSYKTEGRLVRPWFGAATQNVTPDIAESLGLKIPSGVLIRNVFSGSSADKAGLLRGDIIVSLNGDLIHDEQSLRYRISTLKIGSNISLGVIRDGKTNDVDLKLEAAKEVPPRNTTVIAGTNPLTGATLMDLSPAVAFELGVNQFEGVVVADVATGTQASRFLKKGDVVAALNNAEVKSIQEVKAILNQRFRRWVVSIRRDGKLINITVNQ